MQEMTQEFGEINIPANDFIATHPLKGFSLYGQLSEGQQEEVLGTLFIKVKKRTKTSEELLDSSLNFTSQEIPHRFNFSEELIKAIESDDVIKSLYINAKSVATFMDDFLEEQGFHDGEINLDIYEDIESEVRDTEIDITVRLPIDDFRTIIEIWKEVARTVEQKYSEKILEKVNLAFVGL